METFTGVVHGLQTNAAEQKAALSFTVDGRTVELEPARKARRCPIHEGDEVMVTGHAKGNHVTALAYRNLSLGCVARASSGQEMVEGTLCLFFSVALLVFSWTLQNDIALINWVGRIGGVATAALFLLFADSHLRSVGTTFQAEFSLMRTTLDTVRGIARNVERCDQRSPKGRLQATKIRMTLNGQPVELSGFANAIMGEGDEVAVVGEQRRGVVIGTAYRNFTRSNAQAITGLGNVLTAAMLLLGIAAFLAWGWSSRSASGPDISDWLRWPFCLLLGIAIAYNAAEPFYEWKLR